MPSSSTTTPARLFVLGDSISIEYGPHLEPMLAGVCRYSRKTGTEEALKNLDIPQGANGGDSRMCRAFLERVIPAGELKADLMLLNCGLHDIKIRPGDDTLTVQISLDEYRENLIAIVSLAARHNLPIAWVRTTPVDEVVHNSPQQGILRHNANVDRYNAAADAIMQSHGIPLIDLHGFSLSLGAPAELLRDGRHFHAPIQKLQAAFIAGSLVHHPAIRR